MAKKLKEFGIGYEEIQELVMSILAEMDIEVERPKPPKRKKPQKRRKESK